MDGQNEAPPARVHAVTDYLESRGVPYEVVEHPETFTAVAEAAAAGVEPTAGGKTLLLHDHGGYRVAVLPAHRHLDLHRVRELIGATRHLRLATEAEMARDFPVYEVGALPPLGPHLPPAEIVDIRLMDAERALFAAGDHRHSVLIPITALLRATEPRVADVCKVPEG